MPTLDPRVTPVIVGAARTPVGRFLGGLAPLAAPKLGAVAIAEALRRAGVGGTDVDEVKHLAFYIGDKIDVGI